MFCFVLFFFQAKSLGLLDPQPKGRGRGIGRGRGRGITVRTRPFPRTTRVWTRDSASLDHRTTQISVADITPEQREDLAEHFRVRNIDIFFLVVSGNFWKISSVPDKEMTLWHPVAGLNVPTTELYDTLGRGRGFRQQTTIDLASGETLLKEWLLHLSDYFFLSGPPSLFTHFSVFLRCINAGKKNRKKYSQKSKRKWIQWNHYKLEILCL